MLVLILTTLVVVLDQVTKHFAKSLIGKDNIIIIDKLVELTYLENRGAAFGILQGKSLLFVLITLSVIAYIIYFLYKNPNFKTITKVCLAFILGGAIGNFIDRIINGYVVDFIFVRFWGHYDFPVFNIADIAVSVGVILLIYITIFTNEFDEVG